MRNVKKRFTLKNNKLTTIPAGIGSMIRLNSLDLTNNPLESLPIKGFVVL